MTKRFVTILVIGATAALFGCVLISAWASYEITNTGQTAVEVTWTTHFDEGSQSYPNEIAPGETAVFATFRLLEADAVRPSLYFRTMAVTDATDSTVVYDANEIDDSLWAVEETGYHRHVYTLTVGDDGVVAP